MDSQLHEIPGISENGLTLRIFNEAGFFTFKGLCDFNRQEQLLYDAIAKIKLEVEYRDYTESFWKRTMTQCINIVGRVKNRVEYILNDPVLDELKCSLSEEVMTDPVIGPSGFTYERNIIVAYIQEHGKDPNTGSTLTEEMLYPNIAISNAIVNHHLSQIRNSI